MQNQYGTWLIRNDAINLSLLRKPNVTFGANGRSPTYPADGLMVAWGSSSYVGRGAMDTFAFGPANTTVPAYVFGLPIAPAGSGFGMQLWTDTVPQHLAFDARLKPAKAIDSIDEPFPYANTTNTLTKTYPTGRSYAVAMGSPPFYRRLVLTPDNRPGFPPGTFFWYEHYYYAVASRVSGGTIQFQWQQTDYVDMRGEESLQPQFIPPEVGTSQLLAHIIDVTGY